MNDRCLLLEPFIDGAYVRYNTNSLYVKEDPSDAPNLFNQIAQVFSLLHLSVHGENTW